MKKSLLSIVFAICLLACCLVGCSGKSELQFTSAFFGSEEAKDPLWQYSETTTYSVEYSKDYENRFNLGQININKDVIDLNYGTGSYTSTFTVVSEEFFKGDVPTAVKNSDIIANAEGEKFYVLETNFSIPVTYKLAGKEQVTDVNTITTKVYFCSARLSYAPIYSYTKSVNTLFDISSTLAIAEVRTLENAVYYNKDSYTSSKKINNNKPTVEKHDYKFRTIVDNNQLLFLMRNLGLGEEDTRYLPTLSLTYSEPVDLAVSSEKAKSVNYKFNYLGTEVDEVLKVNQIKYLLADSKTPGAYQYAVIQKQASQNVKFTALLTTYAHTLYGGHIGYYGVLVYKLTSVSVSQ